MEKISRPGAYAGYSEVRFGGHQRTSRYVEMRDGNEIAIDIFRPTQEGVVTDEPLPVLWMHTPYNRRMFRGEPTALAYPGQALKLLPFGYVVAVADFRGLYASFGTNAGFNRGEWLDAARTDAYDITEWLAAQPFCSGKVGMWGCSATGGSQLQALTTAPPSLRAVFPMSCEWDAYPFAVPGGMAPPAGTPTRLMMGGDPALRDRAAAPVDGDDDRARLEAAIAEHGKNVETAGYVPFRDSVSEALASAWWIKSSPHVYEREIERSGAAMYMAANLDELGPGYGPPFTFRNVRNPRKLVIGPGTHCDWVSVRRDTGFDIRIEERRFFDHWLKGIDNGVMDEAPVTYYTYNLATANGWQAAADWPLPNEQRTAFYLSSEGLVRDGARTGGETRVTVDYEIDGGSFFERGLTFATAPLEADTQVTGHPVVRLWLSTTATDADVIARIDDLAPDGTSEYRTVEGRLRASLRRIETPPYDNLGLPYHPFSQASAEPLTPGQPVELAFDTTVISNVFRAGHRIRLTLAFADRRATPRIDPAPQITIHHGTDMASALILPVIPAAERVRRVYPGGEAES